MRQLHICVFAHSKSTATRGGGVCALRSTLRFQREVWLRFPFHCFNGDSAAFSAQAPPGDRDRYTQVLSNPPGPRVLDAAQFSQTFGFYGSTAPLSITLFQWRFLCTLRSSPPLATGIATLRCSLTLCVWGLDAAQHSVLLGLKCTPVRVFGRVWRVARAGR